MPVLASLLRLLQGVGALLLPALLAPLALVSPAWADTVVLTDGTVLEGKILSQDEQEVVIETTFGGRKVVARAQVKAVDTLSLPLREQLAYRLEQAGVDPARLWEVYAWAKPARFRDELQEILARIVLHKPGDARARKLLGHVQADGRWMTPAEKVLYEQEQHAAAQRAKGLVLYGERWVTPEEQAAREQGLVQDGSEWVTEAELHRRRGEQQVDGRWVRVGEAEGKAWAEQAARGSRVALQHLWTPHFDLVHELEPAVAARIAEGLEKAYAALRRVLTPTGDDLPETLEWRRRMALFVKAPPYARFAEWFAERAATDAQQPGWSKAVQRQPAFWWVRPEPVVAVYQFPNIEKTFVSNAVHNAANVLLTQYRYNARFPSDWLREGFAYHLELEALGFSLSFTLGRAGATSQGGTDATPAWADSEAWRAALKTAVSAGQDPPLKRVAGMTADQLGYPELVKSWSVVDYLVRWDPARFKAFVDGAKKARDAPEEEALVAAYGLDFKQLDVKWRAWVEGGFGAP